MGYLERNLMTAGVPVEENIPGLVKWLGFEKYSNYLDKEYIEKSALFKHAQAPDASAAPQKSEQEKRDDARRAAHRRSEMAGTEMPDFSKEEEEEKGDTKLETPARSSPPLEKLVFTHIFMAVRPRTRSLEPSDSDRASLARL